MQYVKCYQVHRKYHASIVTVRIMITQPLYVSGQRTQLYIIVSHTTSHSMHHDNTITIPTMHKLYHDIANTFHDITTTIRIMLLRPQYVLSLSDIFEKDEVLRLNRCIVQNLIETGLKSKMAKVYAGR